jgi:hypothetical protein
MEVIMRSDATTVVDYLAELPEDRRETISTVRDTILKNLPAALTETIACGMIGYVVNTDHSPKNCNGEPMILIGLSSGKAQCSLHLMALYMNPKAQESLRADFQRIGKKLDMGKACVRFKRADDLPLDAIGRIVAQTNPAAYLKMYEASHSKEARDERRKTRQSDRK